MYTTRDVYGSTRITPATIAIKWNRPAGWRTSTEVFRYRGRVFGGGFVFQAYGLDLLIDELYNDIYEKDR